MSEAPKHTVGRRRLLGLLGIVAGIAIGAAIIMIRRDGEVEWKRLLPMLAGGIVGAGIVCLWPSRKRS
jgi:uncharacterized membrane protein YfcA